MAVLDQVWQRQSGIGKETTWGTGVAATDFFPVNSPRFEDKEEWIKDTGFRGTRSKNQGGYPGKVWSEVDGEIPFYPDTAGHTLMAVMGQDTVTGAGPYSHSIKLLKTASPPSYSWWDYTGATAGAQARQYAGHVFTEATLRYTAANEYLKVVYKSLGKQSVPGAKPTANYSTQAPFLGWQAALTLAGSANAKLRSLEMPLRAPATMEKGSGGTQQPDFASYDQMEIAGGKATFLVVDETELNFFLNNTQPILSLVFTSGANILTATMSKCAFIASVLASSGGMFLCEMTFDAEDNAADGGPVQFTLVNTRNAAY